MAESIHWRVLTHEHKERTIDWYWTLGTLAVVGAAISLWFSNLLFGIILILAASSIGILVARGPREHSVLVDERGVSVDGTLYPYKTIKSFWVEEEKEKPRLIVATMGLVAPQIVVPLIERSRANEVRTLMKKFATEEEQGAHFGERLAELFGL